MKKILTLFVFSIQFLNAQNSLIVFAEEGQRFFLILNDVKYNDQVQTSVKAPNLDQASYKTKILFEESANSPVETIIYLMAEGKDVSGNEFTYSIARNKKGKLYLKFISNNVSVKQPDPLVPLPPVAFISQVTNTRIFGNVYNTLNGTPSFNNNIPENTICANCMIESDFTIACELIAKYVKGEERLKMAEAVVKNNCINTAQVIHFAKLIDFEIDRLKFTKVAYPNLTDKDKAHTVADALNFNPSKEEYLKYIKEKHTNKTNLCKDAVTDASFAEILSTLKQKHHDLDKSAIAKQAITGNCFMAEQVKQMLQEFNYDNDRLEIAKEAYCKTIDKNNYNVVHAVFSSGQNTEALNDFINKQ